MANSGSSSKLGALATLIICMAVIGGLAWGAYMLSQGSLKANQTTPTPTKTQSPDLQNINDQFDSL